MNRVQCAIQSLRMPTEANSTPIPGDCYEGSDARIISY